MTRARRHAGRLALSLVSILLALGMGEGVYRWQRARDDAPKDDSAWRARYRRMNETLYHRSADPELVYEPTRGASIAMEYGRAAFDADGMRDDRPHPRTPDARTRVAIVGDSLVWSEFVSLRDSLPRRLQDALGDRYEVLPFGVTGYDTTQEAAWYEQAVRPLRPRIVVVVHCMNDEMIMSGPFEHFATPVEHAAKDAQEALFARVAPVRRETLDGELDRRERASSFALLSHALGLWERHRFAEHYVDEYLVTGRDAAHRARARTALARLGADIVADGATPLLVVSPVLESWDRYHWRELHDFVRTTGEHAGFRVVDPLTSWQHAHTPGELRIPGDNLHYGEHGNRIFAATIAEALR